FGVLRAVQRELWSGAAGEVLRNRKEAEESGSVACPVFSREKTMNTNSGSWLSRKKAILGLIGIPVLVGAWWAFRPEKLFISQKVNEAAPASLSAEPETLYTGKLEGKAHQTRGGQT